jgi:hypothetical protein
LPLDYWSSLVLAYHFRSFLCKTNLCTVLHQLGTWKEELCINLCFIICTLFAGNQRTGLSLIPQNLCHHRLLSEGHMWIRDHVILDLILQTIPRSDLIFHDVSRSHFTQLLCCEMVLCHLVFCAFWSWFSLGTSDYACVWTLQFF